MKALLLLFSIMATCAGQEPSPASATAAPTAPAADPAIVSGYGVAKDDLLLQARQRAILLAGAFANDGYKLRDGAWSFNLSPGEPGLLAVFLFTGNEMWFSAAAATAESSPELALYDQEGRLLPTKHFQHDGMAALGLVVPSTGMFYLRASTNTNATPFALVTSYK